MRKLLPPLIFFLLIPAVILLGVWLFRDEKYLLISVIVALLSCFPFYIRLEKGRSNAREVVILSVMTALSVLGRLIFSPIPAFKPVSAMTVITGIAFGPQAGFVTGSMTAILSNVFFGQGPWTPFQMLVWGLTGFLSGVVCQRGKRPGKLRLILIALFSGLFYSLAMDIWTTLSIEGSFSLSRYLFHASVALPMTVCYALSNMIFLLLLTRPLLEKTERMRVKFGVFCA